MTLHGAACRFRASLLTALVVFGLGGAALAQRRGFGGFPGRPIATEVQPNIEYDGRFTFVRVNYDTAPGGYWYRGLPSWAHGYPVAERNLMRIMNELSFPARARRGRQRADARRPATLQVPGRVHHRSELVDDDRSQQGAKLREYMQEGRIRDRRRLQGRGRLREPWLGALRSEHAARAARRPVRRDAGVTSDLPLVLRDRKRSTIFRRPTTPARRAFSDSSRTTTRRNGCR